VRSADFRSTTILAPLLELGRRVPIIANRLPIFVSTS
jgi:hypothetical protein